MVIYTKHGSMSIDMENALEVTDNEGVLTIRTEGGITYVLTGNQRSQAIHYYGITKGWGWKS